MGLFNLFKNTEETKPQPILTRIPEGKKDGHWLSEEENGLETSPIYETDPEILKKIRAQKEKDFKKN